MKTYRVLFIISIAFVLFLLAWGTGVLADADTPVPAAQPALAPVQTYTEPEITISALNNEQHLPAVAYNWKHHEYLVVWHNKWGGGKRDIYAQRVDDRGRLKSWFTVSSGAHDRAQPSVAYDPVRDRYLIVWVQDVFGDGSDWDVYGRFIPWAGPPVQPEFNIIDWTSNQWNPKVVYARAQDEFLVVWTSTPPFVKAYISGRRIKADGSGFSGGGFLIASNTTENRVNPDVAYNLARNEYLVVYDNVFDIFGVRLRGDGTPLGGGEFGIAAWPDQEQHPSVAACSAADQYLVAWQSTVASSAEDVFARFVRGNGAVDSVHHMDSTVVTEKEPDVACDENGRQYMIVWEQQYSNIIGPYGIRGQRILSDKTLYPAFAISAPTAGQGVDRTMPAVAGGGANFLVVWEQERINTPWKDIHGRLLVPETTFLPKVLR